MAFQHGKNAAIKLDNTAGALTDIAPYTDAMEGLPGGQELAESTVFGKSAKTYIPGLSDGQISLAGKWDPALDAVFGSPSQWGSSRTFEYGPEGAAVGDVRYTGECFVADYSCSAPVGGVVTWSATLQLSDTLTRNTF